MIVGNIQVDRYNSTVFEPSIPYLQDDLTWCVSRAKPIPSWQNAYHIADAQTIILGATMYTMVIFIGYLIYAFEQHPRDLIYCAILSVQTLTTFPTMFNAKKFTLRFFYGLCLVIAFWLTQILNAYLIAFASDILYEHQIATVREIVDNQFRLAGDPIVLGHLKVKNVVSQSLLKYVISFNISQ